MPQVQQYTAGDLQKMDRRGLTEIMFRGHAVDMDQMTDSNYLGIDLSLPGWVTKILWKKFRKTFVKNPATGAIRGWNVRLVQNGLEGPSIPMTKSDGAEMSFGHYVLQSAKGIRFPRGWQGGTYLDYGIAGNASYDPSKFLFCPLVAVNQGSNDLLLGWEVLKVGPLFVPLPDFWLLQREGPLT